MIPALCRTFAVPQAGPILLSPIVISTSCIFDIIHEKVLRFHQMNHDGFTLPSKVSSSGDEKGLYTAALETTL
jgi:hypothetical protein